MEEKNEVKEVVKLTVGERFRKWYKKLPESKKYVEFFSAILGVPVLLTVLILNWNNLQGNKEEKPTPTSAPQVITVIPATPDQDATATPTSTPECKKEVGPIEITSPTEDQTVSSSPVCFNIEYNDNSYCSVTWAYRIDNGPLSDFTDRSVCLYNLTNGPHKFELTVKSTVSSDQTNLVRNFNYQGPVTPTPTPTIGL